MLKILKEYLKKATFEAVSYGSRIVEQMGGGEVIAISLGGEVADEELKALEIMVRQGLFPYTMKHLTRSMQNLCKNYS